MSFTTTQWETISEIAERKHIKYCEAAEGVRAEFQAGVATCRFADEDGYGQLLEFREKK